MRWNSRADIMESLWEVEYNHNMGEEVRRKIIQWCNTTCNEAALSIDS